MAAQDAELKLRVSLDLAFFRQQLTGLGTTAAGYKLPINVKFDRRSVQNELNALGANIRRRNYRLEIQTNLTAEIAKAKELATLLRDMPRGNVATGRVGATQAGFSQSRLKQIDRNEIKKLYKAAADAGLVAFKESAANNKENIAKELSQVGRDSIAGLLNGLKSGDAQLAAAAKNLGASLIKNVKSILGIASPSREFEEIGKNVGKGFEKGVLSSMDAAFNALERKMQQRTKLLDAFARGIFNMLGMDAASMRQQRLPPAINWPAQVPSRSFSGPSSTGRALPPGASPLGLPGTAFGQQKYLPTALSQELEEILRGAANAFVDTLKSQIRTARILDLGRTMQPALTGSRIAGLLPGATGRTPSPYSTGRIGGETQAELFARREREARMRSALREMDVMGGTGRPASPYSYAYRSARPTSAMVPYAEGGAIVPAGGGRGGGGGGIPPRPPSGGGGMGGMGGLGQALGGINLPGAGVVREIGSEFAMATKQVLLFGTAYKALAFATSFPAQVGQAVGALQSFNNTLKAISPTAAEAAASNQFILDIVDKYNVPLQSARDGFTKLYASMAPAGFSGDEIRNLFTGVSQAAATFGMSADKVDRVNYAFAQMASKGQVMSEELKGQLGDVLPGAMGIFAEAAGLEGPDAIEKFSKALEDGAYKGDAMRQLLKNVTVVLQKEFGPGAEGAARTFQGVINRMQNSTQLLYEAFEPVAVDFLNSVVVPLTSGIKTITDGFNAFFTGTQAKTAGGMAFAQELERLRPTFEGIQSNLKALIPSFVIFGNLLLDVAKFLAAIAGNPITGFLLQVYTNVLLVNTAFTLLGGRILVGLIANLSLVASRFALANSTIAGTQLQLMLLQRNADAAIAPVNALLGSLLRMAAIGTIAIAITVIVNGLAEMREAEARLARLRGEKDPVGAAGPKMVMTAERRYAGASREKVVSDQQKQQEFVANLRKELVIAKNNVSTAQAAAAVGAGGRILLRTATAKLAKLQLDIKDAEDVLNLDPNKFKTQAQINQSRVNATIATTGGGATGEGATKGAKTRESQIPQLMLRLEKTRELSAIELQIADATLLNNTAQLSALELTKQLIEFKYEGKELDLQDLTAQEKSIALREIGLRAEQSILASQLQLQIDLKKERDAIQQGFVNILAGYEEESNYQEMYLRLINQGIRPSLARARVEVEKTFKEQEKQLDASIDLNKENIAALKITIEKFKLEKSLSKESRDQLADAEERLKILEKELRLRQGIKDSVPEAKGKANEEAEKGLAPKTPGEYLGEGLEAAQDRLQELTNIGYQVVGAANAIGDAFGEAFKGVLTGATTVREALAGLFQSIADYFADMVAQMIAEWLKAQLIQGFMSIFGAAIPGGGAVLGGGSSAKFGLSTPDMDKYAPLGFAKGGVALGGFRAFANGGVVSGPTLGLVGEGRYNEAIIPLPDGKSVPVDLGGAMEGTGGEISTNIVINVNNGQMQSEGAGGNASNLGRKMEGAVKQVIISELRPGGILAGRR